MNNKYGLEKIHDEVLSLSKADQRERLVSYSVICIILSRIEEGIKENPIPNYEIYKHKLLWSCEALCGLADGNNHEESNHISWALSAINKLESIHCLNVDNQSVPE